MADWRRDEPVMEDDEAERGSCHPEEAASPKSMAGNSIVYSIDKEC